jgi:uncharacterized membrane protein YdcZ (DUF606 family)
MFSLKTNSNQSSEPSDLVTTVVPTTDQRTANEGFERTHINLWWLKNGSLFAYFISAAIGIIVMTILRFIFQPYRPEVLNEFLKGGRSYTLAPILLAMIIIMIVLYERPIRRLFNWRFKGRIIPMDLLTMARRRTLNEPYFVVLLSVICGLVGAVVVVVANYRICLAAVHHYCYNFFFSTRIFSPSMVGFASLSRRGITTYLRCMENKPPHQIDFTFCRY